MLRVRISLPLVSSRCERQALASPLDRRQGATHPGCGSTEPTRQRYPLAPRRRGASPELRPDKTPMTGSGRPYVMLSTQSANIRVGAGCSQLAS